MFHEMELSGHVTIPSESLERVGVVPYSSILTGLLNALLLIKSTERHGYFIAITKLINVSNGELEEDTRNVTFPISFSCRTFLPNKGEIMCGVVHKVHRTGVFLRCGPMKYIYLSLLKMPNFQYVQFKNRGVFVSDDMSRIQNNVVVRFVVLAVRWRKTQSDIEREGDFNILASLEGDCLGPVSLSGSDDELGL